jgi:ribA/ribD-fused uncharacterized protein
MKKYDYIDSFQGEHRFLSNFWECPVYYAGIQFQSAESAYQAMKCSVKADRNLFKHSSPGEAKKMGRKVSLRADWDQVKLGLMKKIVAAKFTQNMALLQQLLDTKNAVLIEGNWWGDVYWGQVHGVGENHLGKILMRLRDKWRKNLKD